NGAINAGNMNGATFDHLHVSANSGALFTGQSTTVQACVVAGNNGPGISAGGSCVISGCIANTNTGAGITTSYGSTIIDSIANGNGGTGILGAGSTIVNCSALSNVSGIDGSYR